MQFAASWSGQLGLLGPRGRIPLGRPPCRPFWSCVTASRSCAAATVPSEAPNRKSTPPQRPQKLRQPAPCGQRSHCRSSLDGGTRARSTAAAGGASTRLALFEQRAVHWDEARRRDQRGLCVCKCETTAGAGRQAAAEPAGRAARRRSADPACGPSWMGPDPTPTCPISVLEGLARSENGSPPRLVSTPYRRGCLEIVPKHTS
jgi:hypothetical protein